MKIIQSKKYQFILLLMIGFVPVIGSFLHYVFLQNELKTIETHLENKKIELTTHLIKNSQNIKVHKAFKNASFDALKNLSPLKYAEGPLEKLQFIKESELKQVSTVFVSSSDLKKLLLQLDSSSKPQLLLVDFTLKRKTSLEGDDEFEINTKLLKREFE
jgi:hypothetical protein